MELIKEIEELDMFVRAPATVLFADADSVQQLSQMYWEEQWSRYPELRPLQTIKQQQRRSNSFRSTFASPAIAREIGQMVAEWRAEAREKVSRMTDIERFEILADLGIPGYAELAGRDVPRAAAIPGGSMNSPVPTSPKQSTHPPSSTTARKRKSSLLLRGARFAKQSRLSGYSRFQRKASKRRNLKAAEPVRPAPDEQKAASQLVEDEKYDDEEDLYEDEEEDQLTVIVRRQREVFSARVAAGRPSIRNSRPPSTTATNTTTAASEYKLSGASSAALARAMLSNKVLREWKALARKVVCKVARQWIATRRDKMSLAKRAARDCARLMRQRALVSQKSTRDAVFAAAAAATGMQGSGNGEVKASRSSSVDEQEDDDAQQILQRLDEADEYELDESSQQSADDVQAEKQPQSTEASKTLVSNSIAVAARAAAQRLGISPEEEEYEIERLKSQALSKVNLAVEKERQKRAHFQQLHPAACSDSKPDANTPEVHVEAPSLFQGSLKGYQLRGLTWLLGLFDQGINGILADEMGLGKTIQAIAFLGHLAEKYNIWGPFLVVAPASTLHNWTQEFAKFLPSFRLVPYWGNPAERKVLRRFWFSARPQTAPADFDDSPAPLADEAVRALPGTRDAEMHVVITSYQIVLQDAKFINKTPWAYIVLDEAHAIKSTASLRWRILLSFKCRNRLLLTGTPIQNTMQELWALLHFIMPTLFDSHDEFANWFSRDIESQVTATSAGGNGGGGASSTMSLATSRFTENQLSRLHLILKPFMLRRTKAEVEHEISTKTEITLNCPLSQRQQLLYERLRNKIRLEDLSTVIGANGFSETGPNSTVLEGAGSSSTAHLINLVMQLRKVCNHPDLWERRESRFSCITGAVQPSESEFASCFGPYDAGAPTWTLPRLLYDEGLIPNLSWSVPGAHTSISLHSCQPRSDSLDSTVSAVGTIFHPAYVHQDLWHHDDLEPDVGPPGSDIRHTGGHQITESPDKCFSFIRLMDLSPSELSTAVVTRGLSLWLDSRWRSTTGAKVLGHTLLPASFDRISRTSFIYDQMVPYLSLWYLISYSHLFVPRYKPSGWGCFSYFAEDEADFTAPSIATDFLKPMCVPKVVLQPTHLHVRVPWFCERETQLSFPQRVSHPVSNTFTAPDFFISCQRMFPLTVKPVPVATRVSDSGKLVTLDALLNRLKPEGHRVLIYSQMTRMIDILEDFMIYRKHAYLRLDGSSRLCDRRDMVAQWQSSSRWFVFLLSTRAGGLGINLTAADTVIFYDSDWNPTVDQQAMDRAHRLGQTKPVTVYRLVCQNTIEGRMMQRAEEKRAMQQMVIHSGQDNGARSLLPPKQSADQLTSSDMVSLLLDDDELVKRLQLRRQQQAQRCRPTRNPSAGRILAGNMTSVSSTTSFPTATAVESGGDLVAQNSAPSYIQESQLERKRSAVNLDQTPSHSTGEKKPRVEWDPITMRGIESS
ncbi:putative DNA helicase ino80 [Clonorchis sinensis]|uniref:Chromatin-remodeling ATPase INO80 n=1 Tax=Clonorchis sinensis TaxID=79923 RepID=A0A419Q150_CLOSI|nr:putative DNA helicase ino80 [Clonorchis sinensis]